ncbi:MAG: type II 3-dehydroquinate dehydratase [Ruminococcus sp.]|nr:type II 3-dehydroquinate dehydratase [Oscillospiraceae bacterium]MBR2724275.1 type II 3-dehydroquinate dehydratase [Ruminococcus sp.]
MKIKVINGPNLNMLGIREPDIYGKNTYKDLCEFIEDFCDEKEVDFEIFQSNFEGAIVTEIQECLGEFDAIVINPAAYTHTSVAILDALKAVALPTVEVHLSDIDEREAFRKFSFISLYAEKVIKGKGFEGYKEAIEYLVNKY